MAICLVRITAGRNPECLNFEFPQAKLQLLADSKPPALPCLSADSALSSAHVHGTTFAARRRMRRWLLPGSGSPVPSSLISTLCRRLIGLAVSLVILPAFSAPPPEQLLPSNCVAVIATPDFPGLRAGVDKMPWWQAWQDPAVQPLRTNLLNELEQAGGRSLNRTLPAPLPRLVDLPMGQVSLALVENGWLTNSAISPALLFLCDVGSHRELLSTYFESFNQPQTESGTGRKRHMIGGRSFSVIHVPLDHLPEAAASFLHSTAETTSVSSSSNAPVTSGPPAMEWYLGQAESFFLAGTDIPSLEQVLVRLTNSTAGVLAENPGFQLARATALKGAQGYIWINTQPLLGSYLGAAAGKQSVPLNAATTPLASVRLILSASGLGACQQIALSMENHTNGLAIQSWLGLPEGRRSGLFKILPGEVRGLDLPPFIPVEVESFRRWRLDGSKSWNLLEKWMGDDYPQMLRLVNFLLDSVNQAERESVPGFDVRKQLMGNLGDDLVVYAKKPLVGTNLAPAASTLLIVGATNADQVATAIKPIFLLLNPQGGSAETRDFLGHKIITVPFPSIPVPGVENAAPGSKLYYAAVRGYVAFSAEAPLLEEFLHNLSSPTNGLRELPGLKEAKPAVLTQGATMLSWDNNREHARQDYSEWKSGDAALPIGGAANLFLSLVKLTLPEGTIKKWLNPATAPPFEQIERHFYVSCSGAGADTNGFWYRTFLPLPPAQSPTQPAAAPASADK